MVLYDFGGRFFSSIFFILFYLGVSEGRGEEIGDGNEERRK